MAVIQYTAIVNQIRGKLNGSVFNKARNANTLQRRQHPKRSLTKMQGRARARFSSIQRAWKALSIAQQESASQSAISNPSTDRFGNETILSGYNHYMRANIIRLMVGSPLLETMNINPAAPADISWLSAGVTLTVDSDGLTTIGVAATRRLNATLTFNATCIVYVSFPFSKGVRSYNGRFLFTSDDVILATTPVGVPEDITFPDSEPQVYPIPTAGLVIRVRFDIWETNRGALVSRQVVDFNV